MIEVSLLNSEIFEPQKRALIDFLDAVDVAMNSNTFFLKGRISKPLEDVGFRTFSSTVLNGLDNLILDFDRQRHQIYHEFVVQDDDTVHLVPRVSSFVKDNIFWRLKPLSYLSFLERLRWMLRTAPSPYHVQLDETVAIGIIQAFVYEALGDGSLYIDTSQVWKGIPEWVSHRWHFYDVIPDFLNSTGYWQGMEDYPDNAYFDGGEADSATLIAQGHTFYLLLTNGSP